MVQFAHFWCTTVQLTVKLFSVHLWKGLLPNAAFLKLLLCCYYYWNMQQSLCEISKLLHCFLSYFEQEMIKDRWFTLQWAKEVKWTTLVLKKKSKKWHQRSVFNPISWKTYLVHHFLLYCKTINLDISRSHAFFLMEFNKLFRIIWYFGYVNCCWTIATGINMHLIIGLKRNKTHCFPWCQSHCVFYTVQLKKIKQFM